VIRIDTADGAAKADLDEVVEAAHFAPRHRVASKAHTGETLRATLDDNATWIRRLLPVLRELERLTWFEPPLEGRPTEGVIRNDARRTSGGSTADPASS